MKEGMYVYVDVCEGGYYSLCPNDGDDLRTEAGDHIQPRIWKLPEEATE